MLPRKGLALVFGDEFSSFARKETNSSIDLTTDIPQGGTAMPTKDMV
jgi:hypothetical protein